jgi:hypothetical protein
MDIVAGSHTPTMAFQGNEAGAGIVWLDNASTYSYWDFSGWNVVQHWIKGDAVDAKNNNTTAHTTLVNASGKWEETKATAKLFYTTGSATAQLNTANMPGWAGNMTDASAIDWRFDDMYLATGAGAAARVIIGDASTWSLCRDIWIAPPTAWEANRVTCRIPRTLDGVSGKFVYIFDSSNTLINTSGLQLQ